MKRLILGPISAALLLAAGCGAPEGPLANTARIGKKADPARTSWSAQTKLGSLDSDTAAALKALSAPAPGQDPAGVLPNLPYQFLGPQALVVRYEVPEAKVRALLDPVFTPEVRNGKANVYAIVAEYHAAAVVGVPAINLKAREITYTVMCDRTGKGRDQKGFATFAVVEDQKVITWLLRDVGYPVTTTSLPWARSGDHLVSTGEADFDLTRKTDVISHVERTASLTKLMLGKNDHLARKGEITEIPFIYPIPVLDGYGAKAARIRFGTLERLGLVAQGEKPADIWWWEGNNLIVGRRDTYAAPVAPPARR